MKKQYFLSFALSIVLLVAFPVYAYALTWGEAAYGLNSTGSETLAYGTFAKNWVMSQPTLEPPDGKHVNSIYVLHNYNNIIELGWYRAYPASSTNPQGFTFYVIGGKKAEKPIYLGAMTEGQYGYFQINNVPNTNYNIETWINGVRMYTYTNTGFWSGRTRVGAERQRAGDTNYANFQNLKYKSSSGAWGYWAGIKDEDLGGQEDVVYNVYPYQGSTYNLYIDDHSPY